MRRRRTLVAAASVGSLAMLVGACREPTSVRLVLRTNVPESAAVSVAISVDVTDDAELAAPSAFVRGQAWESPQTIGTLTIVPPPSGEGRVTMRAVLAVGRDPGECTVTDGASCVIARRNLAFVPHQTLNVPVVLYLQCEGIACSARETCDSHAMCVSYSIPTGACESAAGCALPDDPGLGETIPPGVPAKNGDGGTGDAKATADSQAPRDGGDSSTEGGRNVEGGGPGDGGQATNANVLCPGSPSSCSGALPVCCFTSSQLGACFAPGSSCSGYTYRRECDDAVDCAMGLVCCQRGTDIRCADAATCVGTTGAILCSTTTAPTDCAAVATTQCSPRMYWSVCGP